MTTTSIEALCWGLARALELEALAEVRERLFNLLQVPGKLFCVHIEGVSGGASQCRASLKLTEAGANLSAALGTGHVDRLVVEKALAHPDLSCVWRLGAEAESRFGESRSATTLPTDGGPA